MIHISRFGILSGGTKMPYCRQCGKEIKESDRFCPACGTETDSVNSSVEKRIFDKSLKPHPFFTDAIVLAIVSCFIMLICVLMNCSSGYVLSVPFAGEKEFSVFNLFGMTGELVEYFDLGMDTDMIEIISALLYLGPVFVMIAIVILLISIFIKERDDEIYSMISLVFMCLFNVIQIAEFVVVVNMSENIIKISSFGYIGLTLSIFAVVMLGVICYKTHLNRLKKGISR